MSLNKLTSFKNAMASGKIPLRVLQHEENNTWAAGTGVE